MALTKEQLDILIPQILSGDSKAFDIYYDEYRYTVIYHTKKWIKAINHITRGLYDFEDLENEMWEKIIEKFPKYDSSKSGMFTFLSLVCNNYFKKMYRTHSMQKRNPGSDVYFLSVNMLINEDSNKDVELLDTLYSPVDSFEGSIVSEYEIIERIYKIRRFIDGLTEKDKMVYFHHIIGLNQCESANIMGFSQMTVSRTIKSVQKKMHQAAVKKQDIDMEKAFDFARTLLGKDTDDELQTLYGYELGTIKICREILQIVNLGDVI